jgi:hypothetical protein
MIREVPAIPVSTNFFRQRFLFAFATQSEVLHHVRTQALSEEAARIPEIQAAWNRLQPRVVQLMEREADIADTITVEAIPEEHKDLLLQRFASDALFQKSFANLPFSFATVEAVPACCAHPRQFPVQPLNATVYTAMSTALRKAEKRDLEIQWVTVVGKDAVDAMSFVVDCEAIWQGRTLPLS